jgi:energy-coupling factor transporter ATP-binding protein EcfA2
MSELKVAGINVHDVLGIREFKLEPGRVTIISGRNGSAKTSLLSSVQAALGRGSLAKLARVDPDGKETAPSVVLVLDGPASTTGSSGPARRSQSSAASAIRPPSRTCRARRSSSPASSTPRARIRSGS